MFSNTFLFKRGLGLLWLKEKELANKIQKKLTSKVKKMSNKSSMSTLEVYIFINGMHNMLKNLVDYGLFLTSSKECQYFAPTLTKNFSILINTPAQ